MKKNSIDNVCLATPGFKQMCTINFLLYAAVYTLLFGLPFHNHESGWLNMGQHVYPAFLAGMWAVGPLHAYLVDTFRRKTVMLLALTGIFVMIWLMPYASTPLQQGIATGLSGLAFGLASMTGTTLSIDIIPSGHRTQANVIFALIGRTGILASMALRAICWHYEWGGFVRYLPHAVAGLALLLALFVYVPFRAPIGVQVFSFDRFLLGRAWLPAINVALATFAFGALILLFSSFGVLAVCCWLCLLLPFIPAGVRMFVKLSHHCQRDTGNTTFNLALDTGLVAGLWAMNTAAGSIPACRPFCYVAVIILLFSVLLGSFATRPYFQKKRVR